MLEFVSFVSTCTDVYRDCEEIRARRAKRNLNGDNEYAIDPDQNGPVEVFSVVCDFKTNKNIGITEVYNCFDRMS